MELRVPADEVRGDGGKLVRHGKGRVRAGFIGNGQSWVSGKDPLMQLLDRGPRFNAQVLRQHRAQVLEGPERVALPASPVQGQHEQLTQPFPQRVLAHQRRQLRGHLGGLGAVKPDLGQQLQRSEMKFGEPDSLGFDTRTGQPLRRPPCRRGDSSRVRSHTAVRTLRHPPGRDRQPADSRPWWRRAPNASPLVLRPGAWPVVAG